MNIIHDEKNILPGKGIVDYESDQEKVPESSELNKNEEKMDVVIAENENNINCENSDSADVRAKYGLYKLFWGLQSYMSSENVKRFSDCPAGAGAGEGGGGAATTAILGNESSNGDKGKMFDMIWYDMTCD